MLPNIKPEHLKLTYYCLISIFLDITLKLTHFASFFSSRVFPALEFDSNYFGILLWKLVKPREHKLSHQLERSSENVNQSDQGSN